MSAPDNRQNDSTSPFSRNRPRRSDDLAALLVNGRMESYHAAVPDEADVEPITLATRQGHRVYRRTAEILLELARREHAPHLVWNAGPSWGGSYEYITETEEEVPESILRALNNAIATWARQDRPLVVRPLPWSRAVQVLDPLHDAAALMWLRQRNPAEVRCLEWNDTWIWAPGVLLPSTGPLHAVQTTSGRYGLILELPEKTWPLERAKWAFSESLQSVHRRQLRWSRAQGSSSLTQVNALCADPQVEGFIQGAEAVHERALADLADHIVEREASIVLIAGPSSSGKTTTAKRLAVQLQALGRRPFVLSLDNYFVDRDKTPLDAAGRPDFEALEALDRAGLDSDLKRLLAHQTVELPIYDFKTGTRKAQGRSFQLGSGGILILEGIHGLNPKLWARRAESPTFSLFVSAMTPLSWDGRLRSSSSDQRLLRRMVRDAQFRGYTALQTLRQWPSVRQSEEKLIFPFQDQADGVFNSSLPYEVHALRELAMPLLEAVSPCESEYAQARDLHAFLEGITPLPLRLVPTFSLLREFVGQSGFHY